MGFGDSLRAAEDREGWKGSVATSSMVPRRPPRLRDRNEMRDTSIGHDFFSNIFIALHLVPAVLSLTI